MIKKIRYPLRETVVCVQPSLASACGLSVQAVGWDHHEDKVRHELILFLLQVIQIQATVLLISIHALIIDMIEVHLNQLLSGFFPSEHAICEISNYETVIPVIILHNGQIKTL